MKTAKTKTALGKHLQRLGNAERLVKEGKNLRKNSVLELKQTRLLKKKVNYNDKNQRNK